MLKLIPGGIVTLLIGALLALATGWGTSVNATLASHETRIQANELQNSRIELKVDLLLKGHNITVVSNEEMNKLLTRQQDKK